MGDNGTRSVFFMSSLFGLSFCYYRNYYFKQEVFKKNVFSAIMVLKQSLNPEHSNPEKAKSRTPAEGVLNLRCYVIIMLCYDHN